VAVWSNVKFKATIAYGQEDHRKSMALTDYFTWCARSGRFFQFFCAFAP
jgi:hypothetical protein